MAHITSNWLVADTHRQRRSRAGFDAVQVMVRRNEPAEEHEIYVSLSPERVRVEVCPVTLTLIRGSECMEVILSDSECAEIIKACLRNEIFKTMSE